MSHPKTWFKIATTSLLLLILSLTSIVVTRPQTAVAAADGTCEYAFSAAGRETSTTTTKACADYADKFMHAAADAAAARKCYTYLSRVSPSGESVTTVDERACGSDAAGICTDQFSNPRLGESSSTKKSCSEMGEKFVRAANAAAASKKCYLVRESVPPSSNDSLVTLQLTDCGSSESTQVGGSAFDDGESSGPANIEQTADVAFGGCETGSEQTGCGIIEKYLNPLINLLTIASGMVIIIMIIVGGIQYASAGGDASKVAAAKGRIVNAIIALVALLLLYAVLQWLVPGGFF